MHYRDTIPPKPKMPFDLWNLVKQFAATDISKVSIPTNFCEPISMLQRVVEEMEYSFVLDRAAEVEDPWEQLAHVAAFSVAGYSNTLCRVSKPFNPLLGETYEFDRSADLGWRVVAEQVSHHPPRAAHFTEGGRWKMWQDYGVAIKYRANHLAAKPEGVTHLVFEGGSHYTWGKVDTKINNIIVGSPWVDNCGTNEVINHTHHSKCVLNYPPSSLKLTKKKVSGTVVDSKGDSRWDVQGEWDRKMKVAPASVESRAELKSSDPDTTVVWEVRSPRTSQSHYHFGRLACQLNEPQDGVAPTDSRNRRDIRAMECGDWKEANRLKIELEAKQRERLKGKKEPGPVWFRKGPDQVLSGRVNYVYQGEYWQCKGQQDWKKCPDIF